MPPTVRAYDGAVALFLPEYFFESVLALQPEVLLSLGIRSLLLDIDSTLITYRSRVLVPGVEGWLKELKGAGIGVCLVSNGTERRVRDTARMLDLPFVCHAFKPLPFGCRRALKSLHFDRASTAVVGDQLLADVLAGHLAGLKTILVRPVGLSEEPWFTAIKRPFERVVLRLARRRPSLP